VSQLRNSPSLMHNIWDQPRVRHQGKWLVFRTMLLVMGAGLAAGLMLSLLATRIVRSLLFGLTPMSFNYDRRDSCTQFNTRFWAKPGLESVQVNPAEALGGK